MAQPLNHCHCLLEDPAEESDAESPPDMKNFQEERGQRAARIGGQHEHHNCHPSS